MPRPSRASTSRSTKIPADFTILGRDVDGDPLAYSVVTPPSHGQLTGLGPAFHFTPAPNYSGDDALTVKANDGQLDSTPALVRLKINPVNDAPLANSQSVTATEDIPVSLVLVATDVDGDALTYSVVAQPAHGVLSGNPPNLTFAPQLNFNGADSFTFKVNDGAADSPTALVTLTVAPVNDAPVAEAQSLNVTHDVALAVTLRGTDVDGDALTFTVVSQPQHGTVSGAPPDVQYAPNEGFTGTDGFSFTVNDGHADSAPGLVSLTVGAGEGGAVPRNTTQLNGWSCGCGQTGASPLWFGLAAGWLLRKRRRAALSAVFGVFVALAVSDVAVASGAKTKPKSAKAAPKPKEPVPEPLPTISAPAPVPAPLPVPLVAPTGRPSLAALEVAVTVPNEKLDAAAFTDMLVTAVDQSQLFKVISASEVATLLGAERQRQLMGCGEDSCLEELVGALGARYLLQGSVGKVGANYLVTVRLFDTQHSRVLARTSLQATDASLLLNLMWSATQQTLDAAAATLPEEEAKRWRDRPQHEPAVAAAPERSKLGLAATGVFGYQPLAASGTRSSVGGEVDLTWRIGRLDLSAGVVISPSPGARLSAAFALFAGRQRLALAVRGTAFPLSGVYGGGPAVVYEFALTPMWGIRAIMGADFYGGTGQLVVALLGGLGAEVHF